MTDPDASRPPVSDPADSPAAWQGLKLEAPLQLLARSGHQWSPGVVPGSTAWMQELVDALLKLSSKDPLTGLANRRQFELTLDREIDRVARSGEAALVLLLDIDHFKRVNDVHGHLIGDEVLVLVARIMRGALRSEDRLYRFGGEEFVVLLDASDAAGARTAFERLRLAVAAYDFPRAGRVTVSVGYVDVRPGDTPQSAFSRADQGVYHAKSNGRDQVVAYADLLASGAVTESDGENDIELF